MVNTNNDIKLTQTNVTRYPVVMSTEVYFYSSHINADGDEYEEMIYGQIPVCSKRE